MSVFRARFYLIRCTGACLCGDCVCHLDWSILSPQSKTRTLCILRNVSRTHCVNRTMKYQLSSPRYIRNQLQNSRKSKVKDSAAIYAACDGRERHLNSLKICVMKQKTVVRKLLAIGKMACFYPKNRGRRRGGGGQNVPPPLMLSRVKGISAENHFGLLMKLQRFHIKVWGFKSCNFVHSANVRLFDLPFWSFQFPAVPILKCDVAVYCRDQASAKLYK